MNLAQGQGGGCIFRLLVSACAAVYRAVKVQSRGPKFKPVSTRAGARRRPSNSTNRFAFAQAV
jgi:hypothetical protein